MIEALRPELPTEEDHAILAAVRHLTEREREVCDLLAAGMSNDEIAGRLTISRYTVKVHVSNVLAKLHLPDRVQVVLAWSRASRLAVVDLVNQCLTVPGCIHSEALTALEALR